MYTLRLTRALLAHFEQHDVAEADASAPTTRLGDWYVAAFPAGTREFLMCTSDRSGLSVVMPADRLGDLPTQIVVALVPLLRAIGVPSDAIAAEVEEMASGDIGSSRTRAVAAAMRGLVREAQAIIAAVGDGGVVDVSGLHRRLAACVSPLSGAQAPGLVAYQLLTGTNVAPAASGRRVRGTRP